MDLNSDLCDFDSHVNSGETGVSCTGEKGTVFCEDGEVIYVLSI